MPARDLQLLELHRSVAIGLSHVDYVRGADFNMRCLLLAMRTGSISHIAPAREISILLGAYLGGRVLGEGDRRRRLIAAGAFAAGVVALAVAKG